MTAIIYLIPAGRLIPLVVTSFPVLSFHNLLNFQKTILAHPTLSCSRTPLPNWNRSHPNLNERTTVRTGANRWEQRTNLNMTKCSKSSLEICLKQIFAWSLHKFIIVTWIYAHWIWISAKNSRKFIFSRYLEKKIIAWDNLQMTKLLKIIESHVLASRTSQYRIFLGFGHRSVPTVLWPLWYLIFGGFLWWMDRWCILNSLIQ